MCPGCGSPTYKPPPAPNLQPGELLFTFTRGADRFPCELRNHGEFRIEEQLSPTDRLEGYVHRPTAFSGNIRGD
jgi:hypothetical protein